MYSGDKEIKTLGSLAGFEDIAISPDGTLSSMHGFCGRGQVYVKIADLNEAMANESDQRIKDKWQDPD